MPLLHSRFARRFAAQAIAGAAILAAVASTSLASPGVAEGADGSPTAMPIKHLVVVFQENVPFDHYFGTYPHAANPSGEPRFVAAPGTPSVNGLSPALLTNNPNQANPKRLDRSDPVTCGSNHDYLAEQKAFDHGLMDRFVQETGSTAPGCDRSHGMNYYDGNTVTALWNYAQHFSLNDNSFGTTFGPSHVGALNLVSGQTHGVIVHGDNPANPVVGTKIVQGTAVGNVEPTYDDCPKPATTMEMTGRNIGDLLNEHGVTWGWFSGGFKPTSRTVDGTAVCGQKHTTHFGVTGTDYDSGNEAFQYYKSTSNPHHLPPSSVAAVGHTDQANHQYDLSDFWAAATHDNLPAVSFLKAGGYQQGGCGCSSALDEQDLITGLVNGLERQKSWKDTAVVVMYDDSDGGYDHVMSPIINNSQTDHDALTDTGLCGTATPRLGGYQGRCGYGPRLPLLVISPWSRVNSVDHTLTDQTSVIHFVEDNWLSGERIGDGSFDAISGPLTGMFDFAGKGTAPKLFLDSSTGEPTHQ
ncbi:MAG TPA: alkaline phosphatase family protein [Actinoallomurus sp.]|nr:alkaline phosphatase family protein [Actinoallomurus sp.]